MEAKQIVLITGERQVGKSTLCRSLVQQWQASGTQVSGLLTQRTGPHDLEVTEIRTGAQYPLTLPFSNRNGLLLPNFTMDPQAMARSAQALADSFPTQTLVLDELGPLELNMGQGWAAATDLLQHEPYRTAFIVIRPELLMKAIQKLASSLYTVVQVTEENRDDLPGSLLSLCQRRL